MKKLLLLLLLCLMAGSASAVSLELPEPYGTVNAEIHYVDMNAVSLGTEYQPILNPAYRVWFIPSLNEVLLNYIYYGDIITEVTINGKVYPVTGIWVSTNDGLYDPSSGGGDITELSLPEGMKLLGGSWFALNTPNLISLTIPSTMIFIGEEAFRDCTSLKEVIFVDSDETIEIDVDRWYYRPFNWSPVETCYLGRNYTCSTQLFNSDYFKHITISGKMTQMPKSICSYYTLLETLTLMEGIPYISERAFMYCSSLTHITIPNSVKTIGSQAFETMNSSLTDLDLGHGVQYLDTRSFQGHSVFKNLTLPTSLDSIHSLAFRYCDGIEHIDIKNTSKPLKIVGNDVAFSSPDDFTVYQGRTIQGNYPPFKGNDGLKSLEMSNYVTQIAPDYFSYCRNLASVKLSENLTEIPSCAFMYCTSLESIVMGDAVTRIGSQAFEDAALKSVKMGTGLTYLDNRAFWNCDEIEEIVCMATTPPECANESRTFDSDIYSTASLKVQQSCIEDYKEAPVWKNFLNVSVASLLGDVDGDGQISIGDVTRLIDMLISGSSGYNASADVDGDGQITIGDVTALIDLLLHDTW